MYNRFTQCRECGEWVSKKARWCPHCGASVNILQRGLIGGLCAALVLLLLAYFWLEVSSGRSTQDWDAVTLSEFEQIQVGDTYEDVVDIIGFEGSFSAKVELGNEEDMKATIYIWANSDRSNATITFIDNKVSSKSAINLD